MALSLWPQLAKQLEQRQQAGLKRTRQVVQSGAGVRQQLSGRSVYNFCSNDYLGLAGHPRLIERAVAVSKSYGTGSGASHLVSGHSYWHHAFEEYFADITGRARALLFSTGYMANLALTGALLDRQDAVFEDKLNHASLLDGGLLSGARFQRFLHNDMTSLQARLVSSAGRRKLIAVDGVFSMDGDLAPLDKLARLADQHDALLYVDDAHGFGVLGENGLGCCEHFALSEQQVPALMCTLGKALGSFGAVIAGPDVLIESLIQFARPYIYTTALPPAVAATSLEALKVMQDEPWRRQHLKQLIKYFCYEAARLQLPLLPSQTAIQPVLLGSSEKALAWQQHLAEQGFWLTAIRPPTVPNHTARLRITLSAAHSKDDIDALLSALEKTQEQIEQ